jgi:hypothetical protein
VSQLNSKSLISEKTPRKIFLISFLTSGTSITKNDKLWVNIILMDLNINTNEILIVEVFSQ